MILVENDKRMAGERREVYKNLKVNAIKNIEVSTLYVDTIIKENRREDKKLL